MPISYDPATDHTLLDLRGIDSLVILDALDQAIRILNTSIGAAMGGASHHIRSLTHAVHYLDAQYSHIYIASDSITRDVADALQVVQEAGAQ